MVHLDAHGNAHDDHDTDDDHDGHDDDDDNDAHAITWKCFENGFHWQVVALSP